MEIGKRSLCAVRGALALALAALILPACGRSSSDDPPVPAAPQPDFSIQDVNPNSATYTMNVSPRDYLTQVSGWYFGHAT